MRVKVSFRYNATTGEVELFNIDDLREGPRLADHDARHDRIASAVADIVEPNARIDEVAEDAAPVTTRTQVTAPEEGTRQAERSRE